MLKIYTDGSANPNPGKGGFGVVVVDENNKIIETYSEQRNFTTNNEMELEAILYAMRKYGNSLFSVPLVYSDSAYAINVLTQWMYSWARYNWVKFDGKPPENLTIIKEYYKLCQKGYRIDLQKVKGHSGNQYNEIADMLAKGLIKTRQ